MTARLRFFIAYMLVFTGVILWWNHAYPVEPASLPGNVDGNPVADGKGALSPQAVTIGWPVLRGLDYRTGEKSATIRSLDRRWVELTGFMVPLEDDPRSAAEFLLAPMAGGCIHTPPPPQTDCAR